MGYTGDKKREYQRKWIAERRKEWFDINGPCLKCSSWDDLELHHLNREEKIANSIWSWSKDRRDKEAAKCIVLCYYCHLKETIEQIRTYEHGTVSMYTAHKCRCELCVGNRRKHWKRRDRTKKTRLGTGQTVKYKDKINIDG